MKRSINNITDQKVSRFLFFFYLTEYIPGFDELWVIGDEFAVGSCDDYFKRSCNTNLKGKNNTGTHCGDFFEIKTFSSSRYDSNIRDMMACLCNKLAHALNSKLRLLKAIVVVLDNDLINYTNFPHFGMSLLYGRLRHYIFSEV